MIHSPAFARAALCAAERTPLIAATHNTFTLEAMPVWVRSRLEERQVEGLPTGEHMSVLHSPLRPAGVQLVIVGFR